MILQSCKMNLNILLVPGLTLPEGTKPPVIVSLTRQKHPTLCSLFPQGELHLTALPYRDFHTTHAQLKGIFSQFLWENADGNEEPSDNFSHLLTLGRSNEIAVHSLHVADGHLDVTTIFQCNEDTLRKLCADHHVCVSSVVSVRLLSLQGDYILLLLSSSVLLHIRFFSEGHSLKLQSCICLDLDSEATERVTDVCLKSGVLFLLDTSGFVYIYDSVDGSHILTVELPLRPENTALDPLSSICVSDDLGFFVVTTATSWALSVQLCEDARQISYHSISAWHSDHVPDLHISGAEEDRHSSPESVQTPRCAFRLDRSWHATLSSLCNQIKNSSDPFVYSQNPYLWPRSSSLKVPLNGIPVGEGWVRIFSEGMEGPLSLHIWSVTSFSSVLCFFGMDGLLTMIQWDMKSNGISYHPLGKAHFVRCSEEDACLVMSDQGLSLVVFSASQEEFLTRLMIHGSASTADTLCLLNNWGRCSVPIHTLEAGLDNRQLDTVDFFLKSKVSVLNPLISGESPDGIQAERYLQNVQDLLPALDLLFTYIQGTDQETQSKHFSEQLLQLTLGFLNGQLHLLCALLSEHNPALQQAVKILMGYITKLRRFMKKFMEQPQPLEVPCVDCQLHSWKNLSVEQIISDAIFKNRIPEAQVFLRAEGHQASSLAWVKQEGLHLVYKCLLGTHLQEAQQLLQNMGFSVMTELKRICLHTSDRDVRTLLVALLQREGCFSAQEQEDIDTVIHVEEVYCSAHSKTVESPKVLPHRIVWRHFSGSQEPEILQAVLTPSKNKSHIVLLYWAQGWDLETKEAILLPLRNSQGMGFSHPSNLWRHLTLWHAWQKISSWIKSLEQHGNTSNTALSQWPLLTPETVESCSFCCDYTRQKILDKLARMEIFIPSERQDFEALVERMAVSRSMMPFDNSSPQCSTSESQDRHILFVLLCAEHSLHYLLYTYLDYHRLNPQLCSALTSTTLHESLPWFGFLVQIRDVKDNPEDPSRMFYASLSNAHMVMPGYQPSVSSMLLEGHTLLALATNMYAPGGIDRVLEQHEESDPCHRNVDPQLLKMALSPYPKLKAALFSTHSSAVGSPSDISLYHLLQALSPFQPTHFFTWQSANTIATSDTSAVLPHCSSPALVSKLSVGEQLDVFFFLRSGRPSFAFATFLVFQLLRSKTPQQLIKQVADDVYSLALSSFHLPSVLASCCCFLELLGFSSHKLRVDVNIAHMILSQSSSLHEDAGVQKSQAQALAHRLSRMTENEREAAIDISLSLEEAVLSEEWHNSSAHPTTSCFTIQQFCLLHSIPMSTRYLKNCAQQQDWLQLLVNAHTQEQVLCVTEKLSPALSNHMMLALQDTSSDKQTSECDFARAGIDTVTSSLYHILIGCQKTGQPGHTLLKECIKHRAPLLSVLAAYMQDTNRIACLCVWLVTSVEPARCAELTNTLSAAADHEWNLQDLTQIWEILLERKDSWTLYKAFSIFLEDCPLLLLLDLYELCLKHKYYPEAEQKIDDFQRWMTNHQNEDTDFSPFIPLPWLLQRASQLLQLLLLQTQTPYELRKVLQLLSDKAKPQLCGGIDVHKLSDLTSILQDHPVAISKELICRYSPEALRVECQRLIQMLLDKKIFSLAQRVAQLAELPTDSIVIEEVLQDQCLLKELGQWEIAQSRAQYWRKCHQVFSATELSPAAASDFFCSQTVSLEDPECLFRDQTEMLAEQEMLFTLAGHWLSHSNCASIAALEKLEQKIWKCRLAREVLSKHGVARQLCSVPSFASLTLEFSFSSLPALNSPSLLHISDLPLLGTSSILLNHEQSKALSSLVDCLLDESHIHEAIRVCRYFQLPHHDLWLLLNCRALATGETARDQLHSEIQAILNEGSERRESILQQRKRLHRSSSLDTATFPVPSDPVLLDLEILKDKCAHGKTYCQQLLCLYELSQDLGCSFSDISSRDPGDILRSLLSSQRSELTDRAQAVINCHGLSPQTVAQIVAEEGVRVWRAGPLEVYNASEIRQRFLQLVKLCQDPTLVGLTLLDYLENVPLTEQHCIIELLISAHDCFSLTCHLEGIRRVLQACRHLTESHLAANQEFSLMVRLLSGIGRYNEMVYVFDILHKAQHFEVLLRKQLDTKGGLQTALLEYIKRCHPGDSEKHNMTALCFSLHRDIGHNHEQAALIQLKLIQSRAWEYWMTELVELRSALMKTLTLLIDAAESYSKDSCVRQSLRCARLTRLLTLQLHLLNNSHQTKLINLDRENLMEPILALPRFYQAVIVTEAYDIQPDWAEVLYHKVILSGDFQYLDEFKQRELLRSGVFEQLSDKCKLQPPGPTGLQNLKRVLSYCEDTYTRYKLAFENQFYDVTDVLMRDSQTRCCLTDMLSR
ncbi:spatacsin isoform X2 [Xenopus laevis]|uniref:Spatacsin isoform X2 n=2 Tax=Xenopus laevis TaxID=8355 RepID=A0A8J1MP92_XENLA|nr:spatacsin isoform X2 [Xenopus laevis]